MQHNIRYQHTEDGHTGESADGGYTKEKEERSTENKKIRVQMHENQDWKRAGRRRRRHGVRRSVDIDGRKKQWKIRRIYNGQCQHYFSEI